MNKEDTKRVNPYFTDLDLLYCPGYRNKCDDLPYPCPHCVPHFLSEDCDNTYCRHTSYDIVCKAWIKDE